MCGKTLIAETNQRGTETLPLAKRQPDIGRLVTNLGSVQILRQTSGELEICGGNEPERLAALFWVCSVLPHMANQIKLDQPGADEPAAARERAQPAEPLPKPPDEPGRTSV